MAYKKLILIEPPTGEKEITSFRYPPMGLLALATYLAREGREVKLADATIDNLSIENLLDLIKAGNYEIVGISAMTVNIGQAFKLAEEIKKFNPAIKILIGGIHPTVMPEHSLSNSAIDIAVIGEGEITTSLLLKALENGEDITGLEGIAYRKDGEIIKNPRRPLIQNLDDLPIPDYSLLDISKYKSPYAKRLPFISIVRSRGCPYNCIFCGNPKMFGRNFRAQTPERTIKEIDFLVDTMHVKEISCKDTELTLDNKLEQLCDLMIAKKYDLIWTCNARANNLTENLLRKMRAAGCYSITLGVESGNQAILDHMKKQITLEQVRRAVKIAKQVGVQVVTNFMIGNPFDTKETIEQTIDFAVELDTDYTYFGFTTPFPGTELREEAEANNWILDKRMEAIRYDDVMMNATNLPTEELKKYLDIAYRRFYFRPKYIFRRLMKLDPEELKNSWEGLKKIIKNRLKNKKVK